VQNRTEQSWNGEDHATAHALIEERLVAFVKARSERENVYLSLSDDDEDGDKHRGNAISSKTGKRSVPHYI
jgi:hypothetical protein